MSELWDVYTIDRRLTGKSCIRGKQGELSEDAKLLATKVTTGYDGQRYNWIRDSFYFETTEDADLDKATTREVIETKWFSFGEIREMYERGECCLNMGDLYGFELNPMPSDQYRGIIGQTVKGKVDRPKGSPHPRHKEMIYPINCGLSQI